MACCVFVTRERVIRSRCAQRQEFVRLHIFVSNRALIEQPAYILGKTANIPAACWHVLSPTSARKLPTVTYFLI